MNYRISNEKLSVEIEKLGAQLCSIRTADGTEHLWQGDPRWWKQHAPNLFPYIGRLTEGRYTYRGKSYEMGIHGFVKTRELEAEEQSGDRIVFRLDSDEETRSQYPFSFTYRVEYRLQGERLHVAYRVKNRGEETMYFALGGHPGFRVPSQEGRSFEDYWLKFEPGAEPKKILFSKDCFVEGGTEPFSLENGGRLSLTHSLFDDDAVVLEGSGHSVELGCRDGRYRIVVAYPDMNYLGIWHAPGTEAPYVCLEPWSSLPSRQDVVEELTEKKDLIALEAGGCYENRWSIAVTDGGSCGKLP